MPLDLNHLPATARALIALIGLPAALALIDAYGGRTLVFSKGKRRDGQGSFEAVAEIVGEANAINLADHYDGSPVSIPKCSAAMRAARNRQWRERYDAMTRSGMSARAAVSVLAAEPQAISDRKLWDVLNRAEDPVRADLQAGFDF